MKSMLIKHIFMKIKDNYKRFLSLLSMALLGVGFYAGIQACSPDMLETLDDFYDKNNVFDIEIVSNLGLTDNDIKALSNINNIDKIIGIYSKDEYLNTVNEQYVIRLIGLNNNINNVYIEKGRLPKNNNEIVVEKALLKDNNIKINDNIIINNVNYKIVGTVLSPLYFSAEKPTTTLGSGKVDYYAYTLEGNVKNDVYTNIYITVSYAKDELTNNNKYKSSIENVKNDIDKIKESREKIRYNELYGDIIQNSNKYGIEIDKSKLIEPKWYILNRLDNESYKELINASDNIKKLGNVFPLIFFAISILISLISMMRMIEEDRTENGTLKSLGYNNFEITLKYIIYSLLATTIGGTLGVFIGSYLIPYVIWNIYKKLFFIPTFIYAINSFSNALGLWICILCICGTAIFVCIHELKDVPANLMRPKNPKSGKKIFLEKISIIWKKLKFSDKITIRNIFRYKTRVFTTIFGIAGCTALILAGFGLKDSIKNVTNYQFNNIFKYDKMVVINENNDYSELVNNIRSEENVLNVVLVNYQSVSVSKGDNKQDVSLRGYNSSYFESLFDNFPLDLDVGVTDMLIINERRMIMMVGDRGHALTTEITINGEEVWVEYFIPKICICTFARSLPFTLPSLFVSALVKVSPERDFIPKICICTSARSLPFILPSPFASPRTNFTGCVPPSTVRVQSSVAAM